MIVVGRIGPLDGWQLHPLCGYCLANGRAVPATVVEDHVTPHRGDWTAFCTGKLQSLCDPCHKSTKAQIESRGYCIDVGLDGLPIDPQSSVQSWEPARVVRERVMPFRRRRTEGAGGCGRLTPGWRSALRWRGWVRQPCSATRCRAYRAGSASNCENSHGCQAWGGRRQAPLPFPLCPCSLGLPAANCEQEARINDGGWGRRRAIIKGGYIQSRPHSPYNNPWNAVLLFGAETLVIPANRSPPFLNITARGRAPRCRSSSPRRSEPIPTKH
jgi:hypothetical protein